MNREIRREELRKIAQPIPMTDEDLATRSLQVGDKYNNISNGANYIVTKTDIGTTVIKDDSGLIRHVPTKKLVEMIDLGKMVQVG